MSQVDLESLGARDDVLAEVSDAMQRKVNLTIATAVANDAQPATARVAVRRDRGESGVHTHEEAVEARQHAHAATRQRRTKADELGKLGVFLSLGVPLVRLSVAGTGARDVTKVDHIVRLRTLARPRAQRAHRLGGTRVARR